MTPKELQQQMKTAITAQYPNARHGAADLFWIIPDIGHGEYAAELWATDGDALIKCHAWFYREADTPYEMQIHKENCA